MSSSRFPGKMLAPLWGKPVIAHVIDRCRKVLNADRVVVLTSVESSDDVLVDYLQTLGVSVFRGPLDPVFDRFKMACIAFPCDYFVRISADSPLIEPGLIADMVAKARAGKYDFLSNVWHKKFPKGQSVEIIRPSVFYAVNSGDLNAEEAEHVMPYFYTHQDRYRTYFMDDAVNNRHINCCVDTPDDLAAIESGAVQYQYEAKEPACSVH